ncbi:uncharacterized protein LOC113796485 [Dermatophagoides pteronyssinus]|uniref:uncharacterized protein LOC113796485 n=1 Tax=Dermatophagoides pteronyssinus TaxID=6956 RepID=UPI003F66A7F9
MSKSLNENNNMMKSKVKKRTADLSTLSTNCINNCNSNNNNNNNNNGKMKVKTTTGTATATGSSASPSALGFEEDFIMSIDSKLGSTILQRPDIKDLDVETFGHSTTSSTNKRNASRLLKLKAACQKPTELDVCLDDKGKMKNANGPGASDLNDDERGKGFDSKKQSKVMDKKSGSINSKNDEVFESLPEVNVKQKNKLDNGNNGNKKSESGSTSTSPAISSCDNENHCTLLDDLKKQKPHHHHHHHKHHNDKDKPQVDTRLTPSIAKFINVPNESEMLDKKRLNSATKSDNNNADNQQSSSSSASSAFLSDKSSCAQNCDSLRKDLGIHSAGSSASGGSSNSTRKSELFRKKVPTSISLVKELDRKRSLADNNPSIMIGDPFVTGRSNLSGFDTRKLKNDKFSSSKVIFINTENVDGSSLSSVMNAGGGGGGGGGSCKKFSPKTSIIKITPPTTPPNITINVNNDTDMKKKSEKEEKITVNGGGGGGGLKKKSQSISTSTSISSCTSSSAAISKSSSQSGRRQPITEKPNSMDSFRKKIKAKINEKVQKPSSHHQTTKQQQPHSKIPPNIVPSLLLTSNPSSKYEKIRSANSSTTAIQHSTFISALSKDSNPSVSDKS